MLKLYGEEEINMIPENPIMLLSFINMKLRDFYSDLDELCEDLDEDREKIEKTLEGAGYKYDKAQNRFI